MKSVLTFTTTISPSVMDWLTEFSEKNNITKRAVIELALKKFKEESIKKNLSDSFLRASLDSEITEMAEENLDDFNNQLKKLKI